MKNIYFFSSTFENGYNGPTKFLRILFEEKNQKQYDYKLKIITSDTTSSKKDVIKIKPLINRGILGILFLNFSFLIKGIEIKRLDKNSIFVFNNVIQGALTSLFFKKSIGFINDYSSIEFYKRNNFYLKIRHFVFYLVEFIASHKFDTLISNSSFLKKKIYHAYRIKASKIEVLYKTFGFENDSNKYSNSLIMSESSTIITFVKSDYRRGGLMDLLDSFKYLKHENYEINIVSNEVQDILQNM